METTWTRDNSGVRWLAFRGLRFTETDCTRELIDEIERLQTLESSLPTTADDVRILPQGLPVFVILGRQIVSATAYCCAGASEDWFGEQDEIAVRWGDGSGVSLVNRSKVFANYVEAQKARKP